MPVLDEDAIRDTLREVLTGAVAGVRAIAAGNLSADAAEGMTDLALSQRAMILPRFTVGIGYEPLDEQPAGPSNLWLETINVSITQTYVLSTAALQPNEYSAVKTTSAAIASAIRLAFAWPGKLSASVAATPTGILSGVLRWTGTRVERDQAPQQGQADGGGLYQTRSDFTGTVRIVANVT